MQITVTINGTDENPWNKMGLKANPFPQIPKAELSRMNAALRDLDSDPITSKDEVEEILLKHGASEEFIDLCRKQFMVGQRVKFVVTFPGEDS